MNVLVGGLKSPMELLKKISIKKKILEVASAGERKYQQSRKQRGTRGTFGLYCTSPATGLERPITALLPPPPMLLCVNLPYPLLPSKVLRKLADPAATTHSPTPSPIISSVLGFPFPSLPSTLDRYTVSRLATNF